MSRQRLAQVCRLLTATAPFASLVPAALGQNTWLIDVTYSPGAPYGIDSPDDYAIVTLYAKWDPSMYAFGHATLSLAADEQSGTWIDPTDLLKGPWHDDGTIDGARIEGISTGQRHAPDEGVFGDTSNPIKVWSVRWQTDDMTSRTLFVDTETSAFQLYQSFDGELTDGLNGFEEGRGGIIVLGKWPAPASSVPLIAAFWLAQAAAAADA